MATYQSIHTGQNIDGAITQVSVNKADIAKVAADLAEHNSNAATHNDIRTLANNAQSSANNALTTANARATYYKTYNVPANTHTMLYDIEGNNFTSANQAYILFATVLGTSSNSSAIFRVNCGSSPTVTLIASTGGVINPNVSVENGVVGLKQSGSQNYTIGVMALKGNVNSSGYGALNYVDNALKIPNAPNTGTYTLKSTNGVYSWVLG